MFSDTVHRWVEGFRRQVGFWLLWTVLPAFGWIGWVQAAIQARHTRYLIVAGAYLALNLPFLIATGSDPPWWTGMLMFVAWIGCFVQAVVQRLEVNLRIKYARAARLAGADGTEARIAGEYGVSPLPKADPSDPSEQIAAPTPSPVASPPPASVQEPPSPAVPATPDPAPATTVASTPAPISTAQPIQPTPPPRPDPPASSAPTEGEKPCPGCGQSVKVEARVCRHCGFRWAPSPS
jgi:hypothetical protein